MKSFLPLALLFVFNLSNAQNADFAPNQIILKLNETKLVTEQLVETQVKSVNPDLVITDIHKLHPKARNGGFVVSFENERTPVNQLVKELAETNSFEYVEPNFVCRGHGVQTTPNDFYYSSRQWSHNNAGSYWFDATADADIDTDLAWDITQGDTNTVMAIIDSGTKIDHPEFAGRLWFNPNETNSGTDSDNNGYVDDINGYDFVIFDNGVEDEHGHGTNVAGIALATGDNAIGYAGVNWKAKMMVVRALDEENSGFYSWMTESIYYAVDNGADVINMSIGGDNPSNSLLDAVNYAYANNVALVVSGGNGNTLLQYPSAYPNAIAVGATDPEDLRSVPFSWSETSGSNYGQELDFVAPGSIIYGLSHTSNTNYGSNWNGTSQGAPHVAGTISLMLALNPNLTVDEINLILQQTAEDQVGDADDTPGWDQYYGHGRINAYQALLSMQNVNVESVENEDDLIYYPNPVASNSILFLKKIPASAELIDVFNSNGQKIDSYTLNGGVSSTTLNTALYKSGLYFFVLNDRNGSRTAKTFMVVD